MYELFQNFRIKNAQDSAMEAEMKASSNSSNIKSLQDQIDHLSLVCHAMCELMEEIGFNKNMLNAKIKEIDLRDGKLDGKLRKVKQCSGCGRELALRHVRCMYCGTDV